MFNPYAIIDTILITEKSMDLKDLKQYVFKVHPSANKIDIARAVEQIYGVKVAAVNVLTRLGKIKRVGRSNKQGRRASVKRAMVTLAEGSIEVL